MTTLALRSFPETAPATVASFDESAFLELMRQGLTAAPIAPSGPGAASLMVAHKVSTTFVPI